MHINHVNNTLIKCITLTTIFLASNTFHAADIEISKDQMVSDLRYLADDKLQGRANFSTGIDTAADFISRRFKENGLSPIDGLSTYKQTFSIYTLQPESVELTLNGQTISSDNVAVISTLKALNWQSRDEFKTTVITKTDNFRSVLRSVNQQGGMHLILVDTSQAEWFSRYQRYFKQGITKLSLTEKGAIVVVLTEDVGVSSIHLNAKNTIKTKSLTNVVGMLKGNSMAGEIVLYSAHYDHLGVKKREGVDEADTIYNGADDDASGTTAVINLAGYFAQQAKQSPNERTLMFSAFAAEEIGGFGSRFFSEQLNPDSVIAMINIEMIGKPSKFGSGTIWMTGTERSTLYELMNAHLKSTGEKVYEDPYPKEGLFYRSDNATLARLGVPAHSFSSTQLDKDQHYHKVTDDIDSLDLESMYLAIKAISRATQGLVDGSEAPSRIEASKVRSIGKIY